MNAVTDTCLDDIRRRAWPLLVGLHQESSTSAAPATTAATSSTRSRAVGRPPLVPPSSSSAPVIGPSLTSKIDEPRSSSRLPRPPPRVSQQSLDYEQIDRDVLRCTWHLLTGNQRLQRLQMDHLKWEKENHHDKRVYRTIVKKQRRLGRLIDATLRRSMDEHQSSQGSPVANVVENDDEALVSLFTIAPQLWGGAATTSFTHDPPAQLLRYYQGYHDVACILMSTLGGASPEGILTSSPACGAGLELASATLYQLSQSHFRDCLQKDFTQLQTMLRLTVFPLLATLDAELHNHLYDAGMEPFFCLSWVITWFAHEIRDTALVKRLFDVFIVSHPLFSVYVAVAMVIHPRNREELLATDCDFAELHQCLASLPKNSSSVGWKYRPGDGYVSDHENDDDDDRTVSTIQDDLFEGDFLLVKGGGSGGTTPLTSPLRSGSSVDGGGALSDTHSLVSTSLGSLNLIRVPFDELIDSAVQFMQQYPPRDLWTLARRYHGVQAVLEMAGEMRSLQAPPSWAVAPTGPADWLLRERKSESTRARSRSRSRSKRRRRSLSVTSQSEAAMEENAEPWQYLGRHATSVPVVVLGYGPGGDQAARERRLLRRRRRRQVLVAAGVSVAICAVVAATQRSSRDADVAIVRTHSTTNVTTPRLANVTTPRLVGDDTCRILASSAILFPFQRPVNHERGVPRHDTIVETQPVANDKHALTIYRPPLVVPRLPATDVTEWNTAKEPAALVMLRDHGRLVKTCVERYWQWTMAAAASQARVGAAKLGEFQNMQQRGIREVTRDWEAASRHGRRVVTSFVARLHQQMGSIQLGRRWHFVQQWARRGQELARLEFGRLVHSMEQLVRHAQERLPVVRAAVRRRLVRTWRRLQQELLLVWERAQASAHLFHPGRNFLDSE
jgi:Rab-GTPase-TBC domain